MLIKLTHSLQNRRNNGLLLNNGLTHIVIAITTTIIERNGVFET